MFSPPVDVKIEEPNQKQHRGWSLSLQRTKSRSWVGRAELGPGAAICRIYICHPLINTGRCPTPPAWCLVNDIPAQAQLFDGVCSLSLELGLEKVAVMRQGRDKC